MQETQERKVGFLGWEYSLEKEMATCFSILAWTCLSMDRGTWPAAVHGVEKSQTRLNTHMCMHTHAHTHKLSKLNVSCAFWRVMIFWSMREKQVEGEMGERGVIKHLWIEHRRDLLCPQSDMKIQSSGYLEKDKLIFFFFNGRREDFFKNNVAVS